MSVARVVPLLRLRHLGDRHFDYLVPKEYSATLRVGSMVRVPFGKRSARGVVVGVESHTDEVAALKHLSSVDEDAVPSSLIQLAGRIARRYLASRESCLRLVAPPGVSSARGGRRRPSGGRVFRLLEEAGPCTAKQKALLETIPAEGITPREACERAGVGRSVLAALMQKGLVEMRPQPDEQGPATLYHPAEAEPPRLWPEQEAVVAELLRAFESPCYERKTLWGVTGSGKTEVYLRLVASAVEAGAGAILLVPEIGLTPQMIARVRGRFGARVGVLHSGLSPGQRLGEYRRIAAGEATVVVGARSAVFAPVADLRLIVIDESHDASYKQEEEPRYHAAVIAEMRVRPAKGLLLEGSATPPVEAVVRTDEQVHLRRRAAGSFPVCEAVDMRSQGGDHLLAPRTREALGETLRRDEQAIVLLNRRGYAGHVHCEVCGHVMMCAECELSLTYHSGRRRLLCHHCGRSYLEPPFCPSCGLAPLTRGAPGTERLEQELRRLVPGERVFRMDSDVLTSGTRVQRLLEAFASTHPAVLLGTQMVAKGHDFADVTLVVVADADTGLYVPDFRAAERTFQLLTQVAGRAGRAERPGRVLVQTWNPDVPCIRMALDRDETGFYQEEIEVRRRLGYPPFADLIRITTVAEHGERAQMAVAVLRERLEPYFDRGELRGPARLPTLRARGRWHLLVAAQDGRRARTIVAQAMAQLREPYRRRGVTLLVDVDPRSFG